MKNYQLIEDIKNDLDDAYNDGKLSEVLLKNLREYIDQMRLSLMKKYGRN